MSPDRALPGDRIGRVTCPRPRPRVFVVSASVQRVLVGRDHRANGKLEEGADPTRGVRRPGMTSLEALNWSPPPSRSFPFGVSSTPDASGSCVFAASRRRARPWIRGRRSCTWFFTRRPTPRWRVRTHSCREDLWKDCLNSCCPTSSSRRDRLLRLTNRVNEVSLEYHECQTCSTRPVVAVSHG